MINRIIKITRLVRFSLKRENLFHPFFWIFPTSFSRVSFLNNRAREREKERGWEDWTSVSKGGRDWEWEGEEGKGKKKRLVGWEILFLRYLNGGIREKEGCGAVWYRRDRRGMGEGEGRGRGRLRCRMSLLYYALLFIYRRERRNSRRRLADFSRERETSMV